MTLVKARLLDPRTDEVLTPAVVLIENERSMKWARLASSILT
jgi:hypothetical protein